jgi:chemosensory pili system protein ChpA (sensor histidine kinase/response regulator)
MAGETGGAPTPSMPAPVPATGPGRLLLVDDSISVRKIVGAMLERAGFAVVTASDGIDALETLARVTVDAVITDLEMPRLNGYELIEDLRRRPALRDMPVVILTTRTGERHVKLARQLGVRHYATKPVVDEDTFVSLMRSIIGVTSDHAQTKEAEVGEASAR